MLLNRGPAARNVTVDFGALRTGEAGRPGNAMHVRDMIQPLVELYGGCMAVLKASWCGIRHQPRCTCATS